MLQRTHVNEQSKRRKSAWSGKVKTVENLILMFLLWQNVGSRTVPGTSILKPRGVVKTRFCNTYLFVGGDDFVLGRTYKLKNCLWNQKCEAWKTRCDKMAKVLDDCRARYLC